MINTHRVSTKLTGKLYRNTQSFHVRTLLVQGDISTKKQRKNLLMVKVYRLYSATNNCTTLYQQKKRKQFGLERRKKKIIFKSEKIIYKNAFRQYVAKQIRAPGNE